MFFDEISPLLKQLSQHPISFMGGFFSGVFRLNLADEPVKSWLDRQLGTTSYTPPVTDTQNGRSSGPQSINIE